MLLQQNYQAFEIVVVDNKSDIQDFFLLQSTLPASVFLIQSTANKGYSGGNNLGIKLDTGKQIDYHLVLNNDIEISDLNFIRKLVNSFYQSLEKPVYAVSPLVNTIKSKLPAHSQIQVRRILQPHQLMLLSFSLFKKLFKNLFDHYIYRDCQPYSNQLMPCDTINGAAFMISNAFMHSINFLDESVFLYHEEMILGKQIQEQGGTCLLNGCIEVAHHQGVSTHASFGQFNMQMEKFKISSEAYFLSKYLGVHAIKVKIFSMLKMGELYCKYIYFKFS